MWKSIAEVIGTAIVVIIIISAWVIIPIAVTIGITWLLVYFIYYIIKEENKKKE